MHLKRQRMKSGAEGSSANDCVPVDECFLTNTVEMSPLLEEFPDTVTQDVQLVTAHFSPKLGQGGV